jgi:phosphodiesterase/alkaline phosphatase D-like protein
MRHLPVRRTSWVAGAAFVVVLAVFAGRADAAAPTATTGPTTAVGSTTASVTGTVDPGGLATTWHVEYGTSASYGTSTAAKSAGSGATPAGVSASLAGLTAGTTYHYRVVATNSSGTSHGGDAVFTTLVPPDATTGSASAITASSATLNGTVDPNGRATAFSFEYGTSTSYGTKTPSKSVGTATTPQPAAAGISGLQAGRTYHFRIVASSDAGTSTGKDATFRASSAPGVLTGDATSVTPTSATLRGAVTANGLSTTWWFEYGTTTRYGSKSSNQSAGSGSSARAVAAGVKSLRAATTYHYRLVAQNSSGRIVGADRTFSTVGAPAVQTGAAQSVGPSGAVVTGSLDTRGRPTTWWFEFGTTSGYGTKTAAKSAAATAGAQPASVPLTGLSAATTYHYRLVAKSDAGTTAGADATFTTAGVTLTVAAREVVFGGRIRLSGVVPTGQAGEQVVVFAQAYNGGSFHSIATVLAGVNGTWAYMARPQVNTSYEASWRGGISAAVSIGVHPRITFTRLRSGRYLAHVIGGRSFAGRRIQLQRRGTSRWTTVKRVRLGARSRAEFRATLPKGRSQLRIAFSVNQAGAGYLGATSRVLTVTLKR